MCRSRLLLILIMAYGLHLLFKFAPIAQPTLVSSYFADLLSLPILLTLSVLFIRKVQGDRNFKLDFSKIIFVLVYQSLVFELLLPAISARYTSDPYDVLAYAVGGCFFFLFQRRLVA